jgi:hypothetical protein
VAAGTSPVRYPDPDVGVDSLAARGRAQAEAATRLTVFHDFRFVDRAPSYDGKSGYLSQSALPLYFGLGDAAKVESVEVTWPSGRKQAVTRGLRADSILRVTEPR